MFKNRDETLNTQAIVVNRVSKYYDSVRALDMMSLTVPYGIVHGLLGPNGAGKTTLIRILTTLLKPDAGKVTVAGFDVVHEARQVRRLIGLSSQHISIDDRLTGRENLETVGRLYRLNRLERHRNVRDLIDRFSLNEVADRIVKTYSGGTRRRLDLAASMVGRPKILFLDEPTTGLDPRSRKSLWDLVIDLKRQGTTLMLSTQDMEEADTLADTITVIDEGRVIASGTPTELKARIGTSTIFLELAEPKMISRAAELLLRFTPKVLHTDVELGQLSFSAPLLGGALPEVVRTLDLGEIDIKSISLLQPSLSEAFLVLTGHDGTPDSDPDRA